jgi:hypothetical protein
MCFILLKKVCSILYEAVFYFILRSILFYFTQHFILLYAVFYFILRSILFLFCFVLFYFSLVI